MTNIEVAIAHFQRVAKERSGKCFTDEVLEVLCFLQQCENQNLKLIAIGYHVYEGEVALKDIPTDQHYEKGFCAIKLDNGIMD